VGQTSLPSPPILESSRTVKASHGTSDVPDPAVAHSHHISNLEPAPLRALEDAITKPHGATSTPDVLADNVDLASIPEKIGYLKSVCGLDYGWGPTSISQYIFEHLHITAGLSWSVSVVALALVIRLCILRGALKASDQGIKMRELQPVLQPLREQYKVALENQDKQTALQVGQQIRAISKEQGISMKTAFLPVLLQIPFQFGSYRFLRGAADLPVPAFESEHWLWTTDLTHGDPFYVVPLATATLAYLSMSKSMEMNASPMSPQFMQLFKTGLPALSFAFMIFQPGAVQLFFLTNGAFSLAQLYIIRNTTIRRLMRLRPLPPPRGQSTPKASGPAGMNIYKPDSGTAKMDEVVPSPNRSWIDKAVDQFKEKRDGVIRTVKGKEGPFAKWASDKAERNKKDRMKQEYEKYEYKRREDLRIEREYRNRGVTEAAMGKDGSGRRRSSGLVVGDDEVAGMRTSSAIARKNRTPS